MGDWLALVAGVDDIAQENTAQRAELVARFIGWGLLLLVVIAAACFAVWAVLTLYARLQAMGWPILIAIIAGLALIVLGYILAAGVLYVIGGGILGALILLSMLIAVTGVSAEVDEALETKKYEKEAKKYDRYENVDELFRRHSDNDPL